MEKEPFFDEICSKLNIDSVVKKNAYQQYSDVSSNTLLYGDKKHWICCAIFTACCKSRVPTASNDSFIQGNGISLVKLINVCGMNIYMFFEKIETWFKIISVPNVIQQKVDNMKRNFHLSQLIYKEYSVMFAKLFNCTAEGVDDPKTTKSRKKIRNTPYTSQKLFEICWTLFVCVKSDSCFEKSSDLVTSLHLLACCIELIFNNVVHDNRQDLINASFPGLPKNFFQASFDAKKAPSINVIEKLCDDTVMKMKNSQTEFLIRRYVMDKLAIDDYNRILEAENFEMNFKKLNDLYETYILSCGQFDERVFLSHPEIGSKFYGKSLSIQANSQGERSESGSQLMPQTPISGQDFSHCSANKLSPISSYKQNVQKLQQLYNSSQHHPPNSLKELLVPFSDSILDELNDRFQKMKEVFCKKMISVGHERHVQYAEALYYHLLENIIRSELKTHRRFDLFVNDDVFNKTLIVLCLEIILFAFSLHKELPKLLECFNLEAFHFYKLIEVAIRNQRDVFTNEMIKHLKAIEEQCLDSLSWVSGSLLWDKINEYVGKLPTNQEVDLAPNNGSSQGDSQGSQGSPSNQSPKSLKLFFRKFYQLAHLRLIDLVKNLQFSNNTDLLRKIWTLFEYAIIEHTQLMKDRHLDQILMCCVYVLCKIRPNENRHTFADIMRFYRNQPQADSHIYRSVFIEYIQSSEGEQAPNIRNNAAEPEVVSGRNTIFGTESRGDIIYFYNKIFVPKMQQFAMRFSTSSQNNLLLSPLPHSRPLISPRKISPFHDVYVQPLTKQSLSPSVRTLTFTIDQSPSKDLQKINSLINQNKKNSVAKRFNMDSDNEDYPPNKTVHLLISDREEVG